MYYKIFINITVKLIILNKILLKDNTIIINSSQIIEGVIICIIEKNILM